MHAPNALPTTMILSLPFACMGDLSLARTLSMPVALRFLPCCLVPLLSTLFERTLHTPALFARTPSLNHHLSYGGHGGRPLPSDSRL